MKSNKSIFLFCQISFLFFVIFYPVYSMAEENVAQGEAKSLTRQFDHVVVKGEQLKANLNRRIPLMRLYASKDGSMQPIPFQIDEITEDENWVLTKKSPYLNSKQASKIKLIQDEQPRIFDSNDELAFMISDVGDRADASSFPEGWLRADEIVMTDPITNEKAWVYLFDFSAPKKFNPVDYVEYHFPEGKKEDRIRTSIYTLGFSHKVPITWDYISYGDTKNVMDRMKIRISANLFRIFNLSWNEEDMMSKLWQYKDGPIRVIRMVRSSIQLIGRLKSPGVYSETLYYHNSVLLPFRLNIPFNPKGISKGVKFEGAVDFRDIKGWKVKLSSDENWLKVDGKMDEIEKNIKTEGADWFIAKAPDKAMIVYLYIQGDKTFKRRFRYIDDPEPKYQPEFHPGQFPHIGFNVYGLENLGKGIFRFYVICFYMNENYSEEELMRATNIFDSPVKIEIKGFDKRRVK